MNATKHALLVQRVDKVEVGGRIMSFLKSSVA